MRGVAALLAAASVWILVVGVIPMPAPRIPRIQPVVVVAAIGGGMAGAAITFGLLGTVSPSVAIGILCAAVPVHVARTKEARTLAQRTSAWPDLIAHVRSSVAAGATMPDAFIDGCSRIGGVYEDLAESVRQEIMYGRGFSAALRVMREEFDDPVSDRVLATFAIAQRTGGHRVGEVLATLGASVADELRLQRAHDAAMTEQRLTATVALVAPWALLALSIATNPQSAEAFDSAEGTVVVIGGLLATGTGWMLARRASRLSEVPRLFT